MIIMNERNTKILNKLNTNKTKLHFNHIADANYK